MANNVIRDCNFGRVNVAAFISAASKQVNKGSITLWASILIIGILSLTLVLHQITGLLIFQAEVSQAMSSTLTYNLARFDRSLEERYGLFGFRPQILDDQVFYDLVDQAQSRALLPPSSADADLYYERALADPEVAKEQIRAYMRVRAPIRIIKEIYSRSQKIGNEFKENIRSGKGEVEKSALNLMRQRDNFFNIKDSKMAEALKAVLSPLLEFFALNIDGYSGTSLVNQIISWLSDIQGLISRAEIPIYDQLLVNEYALDSFSNGVCRLGSASPTSCAFKTFGGFKRSQLKAYNPYEVEYIITGVEGEKAFKQIKHYCLALRLLTHFIGLHTGEIYAGYQVRGTNISLAVSAISMGLLNIPPTIITETLILIRAFKDAKKDVKKLIQGEGVELLPHLQNFPVYYEDFLRIFLIAVSETNKVERCIYCIQDNLNGDFYTQVGINCELTVGRFSSVKEVNRSERYRFLSETK